MESSLLYGDNSIGRVRRNALDFVAIYLGLVVVALICAVVSWQFWHANRVFTGVQVAGVSIGGMTRAEAMNELNRKLQPYPLAPVSLTIDGERWPLTGLTAMDGLLASSGNTSDVNPVTTVDFVSAVNRAYLVGRDESMLKQVQDQLLSLLIGINVEPVVTFNRAQLRSAVSVAAVQIHQPARPPREINGIQVAGQDGRTVDIEATLQKLVETLQAKVGKAAMIDSPFVVQTVAATSVLGAEATQPTTTDSSAGNTGLQIASNILMPSVIVQDNGSTMLAIDAAIVSSLVLSRNPVRVDREALTALLAEWAVQVDIAPRDARLQFNPNTGTVNILQTSMAGRALDIDATLQSVVDVLEANLSSAETAGTLPSILEARLVLNSVSPAVDMNKIPQLGIRELVASGSTYFAGSSAARIRNKEVAAAQFEGVVIPPGGIFSFNELVEDVSAANGFEDSLIIWGDQTAVGVGGGVCQVSTTIFRAAYQAGMPIVERYNHGYVVDWYGEPGLDATIYTPTVDFRFRNDTEAHLLVDPVVDSVNGVMTFNLYGTKPNRQVIINEPVVTELKQPEPAIYKVDEELATGVREQVEWEKEGKTIEVTRTIIEDGATREDTITSIYQPWQAVILVGPGTLAEEGQAAGEAASATSGEESSLNHKCKKRTLVGFAFLIA